MAIDEKKLLADLEDESRLIPPIEENRDMFYFYSGWNTVVVGLRCLVNKQPKLSLEIKTSDKWIPCSERLPEEKASEFSPHYTSSDVVLVSVYSKRYGYEIFKNFLLDGKWRCESQMSEYKVLAWMPLPEAYKGEEK